MELAIGVINTIQSIISDTSKAPSLFKDNLLPVKTSNPQIHYTNFDFVAAGILFVAFILFVWLYAFNRKRLNRVIKAFYIGRYANQLAREEVFLGNRVSIFLSTLFVLTSAFFITQVIGYYGFFDNKNTSVIFIQAALIIVGIYAIKILSVKLFGFIFQNPKPASDYAMTIFLFCNAIGLFMLPIVICMAFVRQISPLVFIYSGFIIFCSFLVIRLLRAIIIGFNTIRVSKLYLFLYIWVLEIVPFIIMIKLFILKVK
jgi:hypothetical protein